MPEDAAVLSSRVEADWGDWVVASARYSDGEEMLWLVKDGATAQDTTGCACRGCAPHEQVEP